MKRLIMITVLLVAGLMVGLGFSAMMVLKVSGGLGICLWLFTVLLRDVLEDCDNWNAEALYQDGRTAFIQNVRISDNPHQGIDNELWVEGWLDEKEAQERRLRGQCGNDAEAVSCQ